MRCPFCQAPDTRVIDSRELGSGESIRRRRECQQCTRRFTTYERVEAVSLYVVKKDGRREEYDPRKLRNAVRIASTKRPVSEQQIDALVADVERALSDLGQREVPSATIGEMVIERLRDLDPVAYIRFASVYRDFADLDEMRAAIDRLMPPRVSAPTKRARRTATLGENHGGGGL
jgi:transcriptional repressor NrdR